MAIRQSDGTGLEVNVDLIEDDRNTKNEDVGRCVRCKTVRSLTFAPEMPCLACGWIPTSPEPWTCS